MAIDITQDVLVKLLESELVLPREKIRAWMYRVAVRKYIDSYRRDQNYRDILQREFFKTEKVIEFDHPDYEPLYEAVMQLKEKYQLVIDLFYFQDLSIKEISKVLQVSVSSVKINLKRGREALRELLEKKGYIYEDFNTF